MSHDVFGETPKTTRGTRVLHHHIVHFTGTVIFLPNLLW
jgi:hypothetical protein